MVPRPDYGNRLSDHEFPVELDMLLKALGAEVVDYPLKTECCGGHMTQIGPEMAFEMIRRLIATADKLRGRRDGDGLPDVPAEPGCVPGRDEPVLQDQTTTCRCSSSRS